MTRRGGILPPENYLPPKNYHCPPVFISGTPIGASYTERMFAVERVFVCGTHVCDGTGACLWERAFVGTGAGGRMPPLRCIQYITIENAGI